jgi:hypothetical protein
MTQKIDCPTDKSRGNHSSDYWNDHYDKLNNQAVDAAYAPRVPGTAPQETATPVAPRVGVVAAPLAPPVQDVRPEYYRPAVPAGINPNRSADALNGEWHDHLHEQQRRETERLQREWLATTRTVTGEPMPGHGPPDHHGIIYAGVREGSLEAGVDIGILEAGVSIGKHTGAYVGSPLLATRASVNLDVDRNHARVGTEWAVADGLVTHGQVGVNASLTPTELRIHAGGDVHALGDTVNATYDTGVRLGERTGVYQRATANVGPIRAAHSTHVYLTPDGLDAGTRTAAQVGHLAGAGVSGRLTLGRENQLHVDSHGHVLNAGNRSGIGFYPDRGPDVYSHSHIGQYRAGFELNPPQARARYVIPPPDALAMGGLY